jgi:hypothetical protein
MVEGNWLMVDGIRASRTVTCLRESAKSVDGRLRMGRDCGVDEFIDEIVDES